MTKKQPVLIELCHKTYQVLDAIMSNLEPVLLKEKNRIRAIEPTVLKHFKKNNIVMNPGKVHYCILELEQHGFIKKVGKMTANGDKRAIMVWQFDENYFDTVKVEDIGDARNKKREATVIKASVESKLPKAAKQEEATPTPAQPEETKVKRKYKPRVKKIKEPETSPDTSLPIPTEEGGNFNKAQLRLEEIKREEIRLMGIIKKAQAELEANRAKQDEIEKLINLMKDCEQKLNAIISR